jgi:multidrug efflux pump subunit AcrA (membrane-fusion protein)
LIQIQHQKENHNMDPIAQQAALAQQQQQQQAQQSQLQQAQLQSQAAQGLGTPPPPPFDYTENPSTGLMKAHVADQLAARAESKEQAALAARAQADQASGGYAGRTSDPGATVGSASQGPNAGWTPSSPEAHNMNMQLADRIKSGQLDPRTAMIAMQSPDVAPEIKQALAAIVQQAQSGGSGQPQQQGDGSGQQSAPDQQSAGQAPSGAGLGSPPLPQ